MDKKIAFLSLLLIAVLPHMVFAEGVKVASISIGDDFTRMEVPDHRPVTALASSFNEGVLQQTELAIGTILKSYHFSKYDYYDYNETHNGIYLNVNRWSAGTYMNSSNIQSVFVSYNPNLYSNESFKINMVAGVANGYEGWEYAQGDYVPVLGFSAQWKSLKTVLLPDGVAFGVELPLN